MRITAATIDTLRNDLHGEGDRRNAGPADQNPSATPSRWEQSDTMVTAVFHFTGLIGGDDDAVRARHHQCARRSPKTRATR